MEGEFFIDVTQSCRSSNNSGIQVVTRNLYHQISKFFPITPITWDNLICRYSHLNHQELQNLHSPFGDNYKAKARPNKEENPFYKEIYTALTRLNKRINFKIKERKNIIFFPEVFRDKRLSYLPKILDSKLKKVAIFYDANVLRFPHKTPPKRLKNFENYLDFISNCDSISCISNESKITLERTAGINNHLQKLDVHHLPVSKPINQLSNNVQKIPLILCVSTLGYNKNHLTLLQAVENLWKKGLLFKLELVGQSDPSWAPKVFNIIDQLKEKKRPIKWLRHISQDELEIKYSECQFTVYPSLFEGFGLPILESLIRGKPCICGSNGALGEVSRGGGCLNIENQSDAKEIEKSIFKLLNDAELLKKLTLETKRRVYEDWNSYTRKILTFFSILK